TSYRSRAWAAGEASTPLSSRTDRRGSCMAISLTFSWASAAGLHAELAQDDLQRAPAGEGALQHVQADEGGQPQPVGAVEQRALGHAQEIGRASCRERGGRTERGRSTQREKGG